MKILFVLIVLSLLWLFVGCGEDAEEETNGLDGGLPDVATLTGTVTLAGANDHSGVEAHVYRGESSVALSSTDASGNYSIGLSKIGDYTLVFQKDGFVTATQDITIVEGANSAAAATLEPGGTITGVVSFDVKAPDRPKLKVTITNEANGQELLLEPDRDGKYRVTVLPGSYTVIAEDTTPDSKFPPSEQAGVEVKVGDIIWMDLLLTTWPYFEAEDATMIMDPMGVEEDPAASGGEYIVAAGAGYAKYEIMFPEDGNYIIWGRVLAKDGGSDSFSVDVNVDNPSNIWDVPQGGWTWDRVSHRGDAAGKGAKDPVLFNISKGKNTIIVKTREVNTKLDKLFLTTSSSAQP